MKHVWYFRVFLFVWWGMVPLLTRSQAVNKLILAAGYYAEGEYEKAASLYQELALEVEQPDKGALYERILSCYEEMGRLNDGETVLRSLLKKKDDPTLYVFLLHLYHNRFQKKEKAEETFQALRKRTVDRFQAEMLLKWLDYFQLYSYLVAFIEELQKRWGDESLFSQQLRQAYLKSENYPQYFQIVSRMDLSDQRVYQEVQQELNRIEEWGLSRALFQQAFIEALKKYPKHFQLRQLWFEFLLNHREWNLAYREALAMENLKKATPGFYLYQFLVHVGKYEEDEKVKKVALEFRKMFKDSPFFDKVLQIYIQTLRRESEQNFQDTLLLAQTLSHFIALYPEIHDEVTLLTLVEGIARIYAFGLRKPDSALFWLDQGLHFSSQGPLRAALEVLKGDILLSMGDLEGAKLYYAKVDRDFKGSDIGNEAKLKDAKVAFYQGNFEYAMARLSSLKTNPSDLIANDAMRLLLVIKDNLGFDSLPDALLRFARAQFLYESYQYAQALQLLDSLALAFPNHPIRDEIVWQKLLIYEQLRDTAQVLTQCDELIYRYSGSIWSDEAIMKKAKLLEGKNVQEAIDLYFHLLRFYPESVFRKEAQERIRTLRSQAGKQL